MDIGTSYTDWMYISESHEEVGNVVEDPCVDMVNDGFRYNVGNFDDNYHYDGSYQNVQEPVRNHSKKFNDLLEGAKNPLYDGCHEGHSKLSLAARVMQNKAEHNMREKFVDSQSDSGIRPSNGQPIEGSRGLLGSWLGQLSKDINLIPMKMQERNTKNQKEKNTTPHLCGRKSFPRRRNEIKIKIGKTPNRAELFIDTRMKLDGSFVSEEAKTRAEALTSLLIQSPHVATNVIASLDDEYAQVFGLKRPGRVRCLGHGPTPSKLVRHSTGTRADIENSEMVVQLKTEVNELGAQVKAMSTFIRQILGTSTRDQANTWAASFATAFSIIPNLAFANISNMAPQENDDGANGRS
ncbi:uncharacterized protein LOC111832134 [Capsella rubella]|uniref:uncharacterized protein LOC111832134 n=1 Tax=Capsella rubella TaxID=81985 RepID=UPI000CD49E6C|nr:uncharacterized protein LOC111832134 [Capsella rubella]